MTGTVQPSQGLIVQRRSAQIIPTQTITSCSVDKAENRDDSLKEVELTKAGKIIGKRKYGDNCAGDTELHKAVRENVDSSNIRTLLKSSNNEFINKKNREGLSAFNLAILKCPQHIEIFLEENYGIDVDVPFPKLTTRPLLQLIMAKKTPQAKTLIKHNKCDLSAQTAEGVTPLIGTISINDISIMQILLSNDIEGVDPNLASFKKTTNGIEELYFPVLVFAYYSSKDICSSTLVLDLFLSNKKFDINKQTEKTKLFFAYYLLQLGNLTLLAYLLKLKSEGKCNNLNLDLQTADGSTLLHLATRKGNVSLVKELLDLNANTFLIENKLTAFQLSVTLRQYNIIEVFLNSGKIDRNSAKIFIEQYGDKRAKEICESHFNNFSAAPAA